ncbi:MAG TPA: quinoprotein dehydrogenase-associated putative ABC transporter substrate-binding protein [Acidobacteriaceae bacterium]|nr:quinoprotein dehydrogenase-associated putative ABC transporter substrate-binding protein [Acidobacteriaceae bacterium]
MSLASKSMAAALLCAASAVALAAPALRVCADPNNLPYSNDKQQGFENQLASLVANDLGMRLTYYWFPQRGAFFEKTLDSGVCDVVMGVPPGLEGALTTQPYYRSSYVFVSRRDRHLHLGSLDDLELRTLRIGVHVLGDQADSVPPVHALISRGIVRNLVGYSIFGNLNEKNPPADLIKAVENGDVDVGIAWGPMAGYFARRSSVPLEITPIESDPTHPDLPFAFDISIGVREGNTALEKTLDQELQRRQAKIAQILKTYGIPQLSLPEAAAETAKED